MSSGYKVSITHDEAGVYAYGAGDTMGEAYARALEMLAVDLMRKLWDAKTEKARGMLDKEPGEAIKP